MKYRVLTKDQQHETLKNKITELEQRHRVSVLDLIAARAVVAATSEDSTQHDTSTREVESLEDNLVSMEAALEALYKLQADERPGRAKRQTGTDTRADAT